MIFTSCRWSLYTVYPTGCYSYSPTSIKCKCIWSQNVAVVGVLRTSSRGTFARFPHSHIGVIMPMLETVRPSNRRRRRRRLVLGRRSEKPTVRPSPETDAAQRRVRQSIREYVLIWLLQQRLRAVSGPHWRLRCMQPLTARPRHGAWELSDLDHSHAATPQRVTRASCAQLLRSVLGAACR